MDRRFYVTTLPFAHDLCQAINSGINMPSQSLASDITQMAMILLSEDHGLDVVGNVHDALLIETAWPEVDAKTIRRVMTVDALEVLSGLGLRLPEGLVQVEITAGPWGLGVDIP